MTIIYLWSLVGLFSEVSCAIPNWDIFTFTQEWPVAVCLKGKEEHHKCEIPENIVSWGIHGLWPTKTGTEGPTSCNDTWHFNVKEISRILPLLEKNWPNLYVDTSLTSFWEHEWTKHGTCATSLKATSSQYLYFSQALQVMSRFNAQNILEKQGIIPSYTASYSLNGTEAALKRQLKVNTLIQCAYNQTNHKQVLYELEICLSKDFEPVDCYPDEEINNSFGKRHHYSSHKYPRKPQSSCPKHENFYYFPIPGLYSNNQDYFVNIN